MLKITPASQFRVRGIVEYTQLPAALTKSSTARILGRHPDRLTPDFSSKIGLPFFRTLAIHDDKGHLRFDTKAVRTWLKSHVIDPPKPLEDLMLDLLNGKDSWLRAAKTTAKFHGADGQDLPHVRGLTSLRLYDQAHWLYLRSMIDLIAQGQGPTYDSTNPYTLTLFELSLLTGLSVCYWLGSGKELTQFTKEGGRPEVLMQDALDFMGNYLPKQGWPPLKELAERLLTKQDSWLRPEQALSFFPFGYSRFQTRIQNGWIPDTYVTLPAGHRRFLESRVREAANQLQ